MLSPGARDFLFVQSTTEVGGAETVLLNLFEASAELRRRSVVVTLGFGAGDLPTRLRAFGTEVVELKMGRLRQPLKVLPTLRELRAVARRRGVRAFIGNGGHPQVVAGLVSRLAGARSVFIVHSIYNYPLRNNDPRDRLALMGPCDLMLAVSGAARDAAARVRPRVETRLVYNGTPMRAVAAVDVEAARRELGVGEGDVLIGVFGRLQHWKGQDVFMAAAAEVARARPNARFVVVGGSTFGLEPEFAAQLERAAAEPVLAGRVVFTGFRTDVARLMAACDVVCHTSRVPEPFGLVVIEAMAQARPVVATLGGGPSEIIATDAQGVLVPPADAAALARALLTLIDDPARRRALGAAAQARVRSQFSIDVMASTMLRHLDEVIAR